jgi:hypothetical protein
VLRFADIMLGEAGTVRCGRCFGGGGEVLRDPADIAADIASAVRDWNGGPGPNLSFTGAEPFHHSALHELLGEAVRAQARRIRLDSDCVALQSPETSQAALENGARHLRFALLGSTAQLHDALAGADGAFQSTLGGAGTFAEMATERDIVVHVTARVPVCRHNLRDLPATVAAAAKAHVASVLLVIDDPHLDLRSAEPWLEAACDSGVVNAIWVEVEGVPYCLATGWRLHLASIYRPVSGVKPDGCGACPLDAVCGGATPGTGGEVVAAFGVPAGAEVIAEAVLRGFAGPAGAGHHG